MPVPPPVYSGLDMEAYDTEPLPLSEVLRLDLGADEEERAFQRSQQTTRSKGIAPPSKHFKWEMKDVVAKGVYKPWFFTRFARVWIPLGKPQCAMDLKSITSGVKSQSRPRTKRETDYDDGDSSDKSGVEDVWVGCDQCSKWRKVPRGFEFDRSKSFFCHMLAETTCETPEEEWDDEEEFIDDADLIVDSHGGRRSCDSMSAHSDSSQHESSSTRSYDRSKTQQDYWDPRDGAGGGMGSGRAAGKRRLVSPRVYGADDDDDASERWKRARRAHERSSTRESLQTSRSPHNHAPAQRVNRGGAAGGAGGQGMSRLEAVVRVLKATGRALHYDVITRQALQQGIIRFTGSQGTAGESMKAFLNKTIRENKSASIMNMGKGVYGLKEWGRSGVAKEGPMAPSAPPCTSSSAPAAPDEQGSLPMSPGLSAAKTSGSLPTSPGLSTAKTSVSTSPAASKLQEGVGGLRQVAADPSADAGGCKLPALVLGEPDDAPTNAGRALDRASPPALKSLKVTPVLKSIKQPPAAGSLSESAPLFECGSLVCPDGGGDKKGEAPRHKSHAIAALLN